MAELLLELYSEEIPPQLQIGARNQLKEFVEKPLKEDNIKYRDLLVYSSPTRLTLLIKDLAEKIKIEAKEVKGPKVGSPEQVLQGFMKAEIRPNEVKNFEIQLGPRNFSYWSVRANAWQIKGGAYKIQIGSSSKDIYLETTINLEQALEVLQ